MRRRGLESRASLVEVWFWTVTEERWAHLLRLRSQGCGTGLLRSAMTDPRLEESRGLSAPCCSCLMMSFPVWHGPRLPGACLRRSHRLLRIVGGTATCAGCRPCCGWNRKDWSRFWIRRPSGLWNELSFGGWARCGPCGRSCTCRAKSLPRPRLIPSPVRRGHSIDGSRSWAWQRTCLWGGTGRAARCPLA